MGAAKIAVVTGATSGIGTETVAGLLAAGHHVIIVCRDSQKSNALVQRLSQQYPLAPIRVVLADLAQMTQVVEAAEKIKKSVDRIDVLINNAGVMLPTRRVTSDGFEQTFAVNHFAYFLLTHHLLPLLHSAATQQYCARIVNVASRAHKRTSMHFNDLMYERRQYSGWQAYRQSKLANVLFTRELAKRLSKERITANCLHPGVVNTNVMRDLNGIMGVLSRWFLRRQLSPEQGAQTSLFLALDDSVEGLSGGYYADCKSIASSKDGANEEDANRLWAYTESQLHSFLQ